MSIAAAYFQISMSVQQAIHVKTGPLVSTKLVDISASVFPDTLEFTAIKVKFLFECIFFKQNSWIIDKEWKVNIYVPI